jgi:putative membrane protein insertion efficiency factor
MKWLVLAAIRLYQRTFSRVLPPSCRFVPSCSEYGHEAIERYGIARGGAMAVWRVMRCNPWGGHGYDPVPDRHRTKEQGHSARARINKSPADTDIHLTALTPRAPGHSLTEG